MHSRTAKPLQHLTKRVISPSGAWGPGARTVRSCAREQWALSLHQLSHHHHPHYSGWLCVASLALTQSWLCVDWCEPWELLSVDLTLRHPRWRIGLWASPETQQGLLCAIQVPASESQMFACGMYVLSLSPFFLRCDGTDIKNPSRRNRSARCQLDL